MAIEINATKNGLSTNTKESFQIYIKRFVAFREIQIPHSFLDTTIAS